VKIFSVLYGDNVRVVRRQVKNQTRVSTVENIEGFYYLLLKAHKLFVTPSYTDSSTSNTLELTRLLNEKLAYNGKTSKVKFKKCLIKCSKYSMKLQPLQCSIEVFEKQYLSNQLIFTYQLLKAIRLNKQDINNQINIVLASVIKQLPPEYILIFSNYLIENARFTNISKSLIDKCMCVKIVYTYTNINDSENLKILLHRNQKEFVEFGQQIINYSTILLKHRNGKITNNWIYC
jgi:hypothetical protein